MFRNKAGNLLGWVLVAVLGLSHDVGAWRASGGWRELSSDWPLAIHDHALQFHSSTIAPRFLRQSWTTAGYDPSFMAGYPKSLLFPQSATMFDVAGFLTGSYRPAQTYKFTILIAMSLLPWLVALAGWLWNLGSGAIATSVAAFLLYVWTDGGGAGFPLNYALFGMVPYLLSVPLSLVVVALFTRYLDQGGAGRWLAATLASIVVFLIHVTSVMLLAPVGLASYVFAVWNARRAGQAFPGSKHLGIGSMPVLAVAANAFWWWPALWLLEMKGSSSFAFEHSEESVWGRVARIVTSEAPIQGVLVALLIPGLVVLGRRDKLAAMGLGAFAAVGFFWGYLAAWFPWLGFLQPGRHTYAFFAAGSVASGILLAELLSKLREGSGRLDLWLGLGLVAIGLRLFGPSVVESVGVRLGRGDQPPFLSSRPTPRQTWIVATIRAHLKPGERILYEESGTDLPGVPDPYQGGRYSGLLPYMTGVEVIGGPYLRVALTTNFTQFGEGKLFGNPDWDEPFFRKYMRLYGPVAIICWSPRALAFCRAHPDLIEVVDSHAIMLPVFDPREGRWVRSRSELLFGRIRGFGGKTIRGQAEVVAEPGRLRVLRASSDELDGSVVLRYHSVPYLRGRPPGGLDAVRLEEDPVPFLTIGARSTPMDLQLDVPP